MKKLFKLLGINLIVLNSAIVVVGCRPASLGEVWVITDGGDLFDKAFNQQVVEGGQEFVSEFNENRELISNIPGFENWKNQAMRLKWIIAKDGDLSTLQNNYNIAGYAGAKTIIGIGFHHISALTRQVQQVYNNLGIRFILVDSELPNPINVAGLTYASDQSGYLAGLAGAIWLAANHEQYETNDGLKMSTFGGMPTDVIVQTMMGYYWGVEYFNNYKNSDSDMILTMINAIRTSLNLPVMTAQQLANINIIFDKLQDNFSGGFDSGTNNARNITSQLINVYKSDIVLPVAGAQTIDLISAIVNSQNNSSAKIIGVDVDQSLQYDYAKDLFITSALKGIHSSVNWMLWNSFNLYKDKEAGTIVGQPDAEKYFNGEAKYTPLSGADYTGISDNEAISKIYDTLVKSTTYWNLAKKVSTIFTKLNADLTPSNDPKKWSTAWLNAVDKNNPEYNPWLLPDESN